MKYIHCCINAWWEMGNQVSQRIICWSIKTMICETLGNQDILLTIKYGRDLSSPNKVPGSTYGSEQIGGVSTCLGIWWANSITLYMTLTRCTSFSEDMASQFQWHYMDVGFFGKIKRCYNSFYYWKMLLHISLNSVKEVSLKILDLIMYDNKKIMQITIFLP